MLPSTELLAQWLYIAKNQPNQKLLNLSWEHLNEEQKQTYLEQAAALINIWHTHLSHSQGFYSVINQKGGMQIEKIANIEQWIELQNSSEQLAKLLEYFENYFSDSYLNPVLKTSYRIQKVNNILKTLEKFIYEFAESIIVDYRAIVKLLAANVGETHRVKDNLLTALIKQSESAIKTVRDIQQNGLNHFTWIGDDYYDPYKSPYPIRHLKEKIQKLQAENIKLKAELELNNNNEESF